MHAHMTILQVQPAPPDYCFLWADRWPWPDLFWWLCMTKGEWSGWMQAIGALVAIGIAIELPRRAARKAHKAIRMGHLITIATDVRIADRQASVYLDETDGFKVPAYRVPLYGADTALPWLLADGSLTTDQSVALVQWYVDARSFNYLLDIGQELKNHRGAPAEGPRTAMKAKHLVPGSGTSSRFDDAIKALRQLGLSEQQLARIPFNAQLDNDE